MRTGDGKIQAINLEHRMNDRVVFSVPVNYKIFQLENLEKDVKNETLGLKAAIEDMSLGGIQVVSEKPFSEGAVIELELPIPKDGSARTVAKVVWCREEGVGKDKKFRSGIQFIPVFENDLKRVKDYFEEMGKA